VILIWDNGGSYSDHEISFIEIGSLPVADVEAVLRARDSHWSRDAYVVALVEAVEWRNRKPGVLGAFVVPQDVSDGRRSVLRRAITDAVAQHLTVEWRRLWPSDATVERAIAMLEVRE
jgi:hypothetical protein